MLDVGEAGSGARRSDRRDRGYEGRGTRERRQGVRQHRRHRPAAPGRFALVAPRPSAGMSSFSRARSAITASPFSRRARGLPSRAPSPATRRRCTDWSARSSTLSRVCTPCATQRAAGSPPRCVEIATRAAPRHRGRRDGRPGTRRRARRVRDPGLDPLLVANEGKLVAFVPEEGAGACARGDARVTRSAGTRRSIGRVTGEHPGRVVLRTPIGGQARARPPVRGAAATHLLTGRGTCFSDRHGRWPRRRRPRNRRSSRFADEGRKAHSIRGLERTASLMASLVALLLILLRRASRSWGLPAPRWSRCSSSARLPACRYRWTRRSVPRHHPPRARPHDALARADDQAAAGISSASASPPRSGAGWRSPPRGAAARSRWPSTSPSTRSAVLILVTALWLIRQRFHVERRIPADESTPED